jgi:nicotinate phosphoribosyltransferase
MAIALCHAEERLMSKPSTLYGTNLTLLTDLYQLTMAYGYWKSGEAETEAIFNLFFRKHPFKGGYTIACGLSHVVDLMENFRFEDEDLEYLATLEGNNGERLFEDAFLAYLGEMSFECDVDAVPEGTLVFPHEPMIRLRGPLIQCQLLETAMLSVVNFQTLIATKASRVALAAGGEPILEFGLRRAQGVDGGVSASRAAYVGGVAATSNVLAGKLFGIPVKGTHAHSWVMCFDSEMEAFEKYADAMPNNCVFLVDTYDTVEGVKKAIEVGQKLREKGHEMVGVRLDSGDLAYLSIQARELLDAAGFPDASIVASNNLDEHVITSLKQQGARIGVWGVGTKLATAYDQPALGGVYKLSAIRRKGEEVWHDRVKLSEQAIKVSNPGILQVRRFTRGDEHIADMIFDEREDITRDVTIIDPMDMTRRLRIPEGTTSTDLLEPVYRGGVLQHDELPDVHQARARAQEQLEQFHSGIKRFVHPHQYPVGLEKNLFDHKTRLILEARGFEH